jgi:hypothetical protein
MLYVIDQLHYKTMGFALPLQPSSVPQWTITDTLLGPWIAGDDAGNVAVCGASGELDVLTAPVTSASTPAFALHPPVCRYVAFDRAGTLYTLATDITFDAYAAPIAASSAPVAVAPGPLYQTGIAFDPITRWMYVNALPQTGNGIVAFRPPYTGAPDFVISHGVPRNSELQGIAIDGAGNLYGLGPAASSPQSNSILVYKAPLSASSDTAYSIAAPAAVMFPGFMHIAADRAGNLYVSDYGANEVLVYTQPLSAASVPAFALSFHPPSNPLWGSPIAVAVTP